MAVIETFPRGSRVGVNRDGVAVGHASCASKKGGSESWTAFVYIEEPPFDYPVPDFPTAEKAVAYIAEHGVPRGL